MFYIFLYGKIRGLKTTESSGGLKSNRKDQACSITKCTAASTFLELSTLQVSFKTK